MPDRLHPVDLIIAKRDGHELSTAEITRFVRFVVESSQAPSQARPGQNTQPPALAITEAQIAAFLMAVFQRGLSARELADFTDAMRRSGEVLDLASLGAFAVDKHSTGGVGDKTSLLIAPILAAAGHRAATNGLPPLVLPMISGRSLGHTGGTLDKLESIPGFRTELSLTQITELLPRTHAVLVGQSPHLVPADRVLYALRDHTGTVESPELITASIMSKKLAEDLRGLVLDVKVGSGAFMPTPEASRHLATLLVETGKRAGTRTVALLTAMDQPLGRFAGNWLEVQECADILQGVRHPLSGDLIELSLALSGHMLHLAGHSATPEAGGVLADTILRSGEALTAWLRIVQAQGGDTSVFQEPSTHHRANSSSTVRAPMAGFLCSMDCKEVGWAVQRLGAGRARPGAPVSAHAGLEVHAKLGDAVQPGQPLFTLFADHPALLEEPARILTHTVQIGSEPPTRLPLIRDVIL